MLIAPYTGQAPSQCGAPSLCSYRRLIIIIDYYLRRYLRATLEVNARWHL
jgi:hypothetical protein